MRGAPTIRAFVVAVLVVSTIATQVSAAGWGATVVGRGSTAEACIANYEAEYQRLSDRCTDQPGGGEPRLTEAVVGDPIGIPHLPRYFFWNGYVLARRFSCHLPGTYNGRGWDRPDAEPQESPVVDEPRFDEPEPEKSPVVEEPRVEEPTPVESPVMEEFIVEEPSPVESPVGLETGFGAGPFSPE